MSDGEGGLNAALEDEIVEAAALCRDGEFLKPQLIEGGQ